MTDLPTGTVTFLFTDIVGSTRLWQQDPDAMGLALAQHDDLLRQAVEASDGHVIKSTGDGMYAVFARAHQAVEAAINAQAGLQQESLALPLAVRMVIHTGEAEERAGDYFGTALNRAARLLDTGHGGQMLASAATREIAGEAGFGFVDLGRHRLRDLARPEHIYQVLASGLPASFPPLRSLDARPHNLPIQLTSFVGRDVEVADVSNLLADTRLVTLTGTGGTGKTRLALQVAAESLDSYPDGAWLVELAPITDPDLVAAQAAEPFGVRALETTSDRGLESVLAGYLADKRLLIVLDNCEHLLEPSARLVERLLQSCPAVKILATSRELLGAPGETVYSTPPLSLPVVEASGLESADAVLLFVDRAAQVQPGFALTEANVATVRKITERLDGLPLAIELAASRVNLLAPAQILQRLEDQVRLLGSARRAGGRHSTLETAMDWSYELLTEEEQSLFRRLSVFSGGWALEAAESVCKLVDREVLTTLGRLVDQSLVAVTDLPGAYRYRLLEPVRQYAAKKLRASGEEQQVRLRHAEYFLAFAEIAEPGLRGHLQDDWVRRLDLEHDNLRGAMEWSLMEGEGDLALRLVAATAWFWWVRGYWKEAQDWFRRIYDAASDADDVLRARAVYKVAGLEVQQSNPSRAKPLLEATVPVLQDRGTDSDVAFAKVLLSDCLLDPQDAIPLAEEAVALFVSAGDRWGESLARFTFGQQLSSSGNSAQGVTEMRRAIDTLVDLGDRWTAGWFSFNLGHSLANDGKYEQARRVIEDTLALVEGTEDRWVTPHCKSRLALIAAMTGERERAKRLCAEALPVHERIGDQNCVALINNVLGDVFFEEDDFVAARSHLLLGLEGYRKLQNPYGIVKSLRKTGVVMAGLDPRRATEILGASESLREGLGAGLTVYDRAQLEAARRSLQLATDPDIFSQWWASGSAMDTDEAIEHAKEAP